MTRQRNILDDLQSYREAEGLSITELADRLGFTRPYLTDILNGKRIPGAKFTASASSFLLQPDKNRNNEDISTGNEMNLHPKILAQAKEIMDEEGFTTMEQLVTWLVKEHKRRETTKKEGYESPIKRELDQAFDEAFGKDRREALDRQPNLLEKPPPGRDLQATREPLD